MTSSFRVGGVAKNSAGAADGNSPNQSLAGGALADSKKKPAGATTPADKSARQQELETQGRHVRAKVEGYSGGGADDGGATGKPNKTTPHTPGHQPHDTKTSSGKSHGKDGKDGGGEQQFITRPTADRPQGETSLPSNARSDNNTAFRAISENGLADAKSTPPRDSRGANPHSPKADSAGVTSADTPTADLRFNNEGSKGSVGSSDETPRSFLSSESGKTKSTTPDDADAGHGHRFGDDGMRRPNHPGKRSDSVSFETEGDGHNYLRFGKDQRATSPRDEGVKGDEQNYLRLRVDARAGEANGPAGRRLPDGDEGNNRAWLNPETKQSGGSGRRQINVGADFDDAEMRGRNLHGWRANETPDDLRSGSDGRHNFLKGHDKPHEHHGARHLSADSDGYFEGRPENRQHHGTPHEKRADHPSHIRPATSHEYASPREYAMPPRNEAELLAQTRAALRRELRTTGHEKALRFVEPHDELTNRYVEKLILRANNFVGEGSDVGRAPEKIARRIAGEVVSAARLSESFARLEHVGGEPVRRAQEKVMHFLTRQLDREGRAPAEVNVRFGVSAEELLRDLSSGALLRLKDVSNPFPLTARARVVSEMIELLRTLDAIDKFLGGKFPGEHISGRPGTPVQTTVDVESLVAMLGGRLGGRLDGKLGVTLDAEAAEEIARMLLRTAPTLPGVAGREEIPRFVAALGGMVTDAAGRPLLTAEGTPLKLHELLWLHTLGGTLTSVLSTDRFPTTLSPLLVYGFDSVFSLIGFDGRSPAQPRFVVIQSQMNASEFEWVFGQAPLSEGWMRAVIERLKDSALTDHNALGEVLEEALTDGRLYSAVLRGTIEAGTPVADSFTLRPEFNFDGPLPAPAV